MCIEKSKKVCHTPLYALLTHQLCLSSLCSAGKWRESSVLHLLVHVENAQHTAQDGFLGLLGSNAVPDVAQSRAKVGSARREASPEELCH